MRHSPMGTAGSYAQLRDWARAVEELRLKGFPLESILKMVKMLAPYFITICCV